MADLQQYVNLIKRQIAGMEASLADGSADLEGRDKVERALTGARAYLKHLLEKKENEK